MAAVDRLKPRTKLARSLRRRATDAERRLWWALREGLPAYRFRRQHPVGRYIVDFACPAHKLAVEIDGSQHMLHQELGARRSAELATAGYRVMRFWSDDVLTNTPGIVEIIRGSLERRCQQSLSALQGGEGA